MSGVDAREQPFRAYVARRGQGLWRRAWLLAAGERPAAEALLDAALATTYVGWRPDSDDAVETHLALRTMTRAAADRVVTKRVGTGRVGTGRVVADPPAETVSGGPDGPTQVEGRVTARDEATDTMDRLGGLDPSARAAVLAAYLDGTADPRALARTLGRGPRAARLDLARGRAAWPGAMDPDGIAERLAALERDLDATPSPGLVERALHGGCAAEHGRRRWAGLGRRVGSAGTSWPAIALVVAIAVAAAGLGARQLSAAVPESAPTPPPESFSAEPTLRPPTVTLDDLPQGRPAELRVYLARDATGHLALMAEAGRVPLPGAADAAIVGVTPVGVFVLLTEHRWREGVDEPSRVVLVAPGDTAAREVLPAVDWVTPSHDGRYVLVMPYRPRPSGLVTGPPAPIDVTILRVSDGVVVASRSVAGVSALAWVGDRLVIGLLEGPGLLWGRETGWTDVAPIEQDGLVIAIDADSVLTVGPSRSGGRCLRTWSVRSGMDGADQADLWCVDEALLQPVSVSPTGRWGLVWRVTLASGAAGGLVMAGDRPSAALARPIGPARGRPPHWGGESAGDRLGGRRSLPLPREHAGGGDPLRRPRPAVRASRGADRPDGALRHGGTFEDARDHGPRYGRPGPAGSGTGSSSGPGPRWRRGVGTRDGGPTRSGRTSLNRRWSATGSPSPAARARPTPPVCGPGPSPRSRSEGALVRRRLGRAMAVRSRRAVHPDGAVRPQRRASDARFGAVEVDDGTLVTFALPAGAMPFGVRTGGRLLWENGTSLLFQVPGAGVRGVRCDALSGRCERAALPDDYWDGT